MGQYRYISSGFRGFRIGKTNPILIPQGWIVEKYSEKENVWIYIDCMHPDDAVKFVEKYNKE